MTNNTPESGMDSCNDTENDNNHIIIIVRNEFTSSAALQSHKVIDGLTPHRVWCGQSKTDYYKHVIF